MRGVGRKRFALRLVQFKSDHKPRFAFLGDQVLSFIATEVVFERYPFARPSFLTVSHSTNVNLVARAPELCLSTG